VGEQPIGFDSGAFMDGKESSQESNYPIQSCGRLGT